MVDELSTVYDERSTQIYTKIIRNESESSQNEQFVAESRQKPAVACARDGWT